MLYVTLTPKVNAKGKTVGICNGVPYTAAPVFCIVYINV